MIHQSDRAALEGREVPGPQPVHGRGSPRFSEWDSAGHCWPWALGLWLREVCREPHALRGTQWETGVCRPSGLWEEPFLGGV